MPIRWPKNPEPARPPRAAFVIVNEAHWLPRSGARIPPAGTLAARGGRILRDGRKVGVMASDLERLDDGRAHGLAIIELTDTEALDAFPLGIIFDPHG